MPMTMLMVRMRKRMVTRCAALQHTLRERLFRLCKIVKILRIFRTLKFFSELRLMLDCTPAAQSQE